MGKLSSRDLPLWARGTTAAFLMLGAWFSTQYQSFIAMVGGSVVEISAGVIAFSILLGMRLPLDLWPRAPRRETFSIPLAILVALVLGGLILVATSTRLPAAFLETDRSAVAVVVVGGTAMALGWGRVRQRAYARWYLVAAICAVVPVTLGMLGLAVRGEVSSFNPSVFLQAACLFSVIGAAGSLVTQEIAFRRLLIGQSGDAGLIVVLMAAAVFGLWHAIIPTEGTSVPSVLQGTANGVVLGSLYILSRSLLVPAAFHGIQSGMIKGFYAAARTDTGQPLEPGLLWIPIVLVTLITGGFLAYAVSRRAGFFGAAFTPSPSTEPNDAAGD